MKCFYHGDLDGKAAGFCVHAWAGIDGPHVLGDNIADTDPLVRFILHPLFVAVGTIDSASPSLMPADKACRSIVVESVHRAYLGSVLQSNL